MLTVFENVPDVFVRAYDGWFQEWGRRYREIGSVAVFRLRKPLEPSPLMLDRRRIVGVRLRAEIDGGRMVVRPADEANEEAIRRHVADCLVGLLN